MGINIMRIGINLLYLIPTVVGGTQTYAVSLIRELASIDHQNQYYIFLNKAGAFLDLPQVGNFHRIVCGLRGYSRPRRYAWEQIILPLQLLYYKIDLVHSLGYVGPLFCPCYSIVTIHDLNFIAVKNTMPDIKKAALGYFTTQSARRVNHIITDSNFSKREIIQELNIEPAKISVTYLGHPLNHHLLSQNNWNKFKQLHTISEPYIVAFGGRYLHKNIQRLLQAFMEVRKNLPYKLVLIGTLPENVHPEEFSKDIIATGYVPSEYVLPLLMDAELYVLPSLYEGFGLTVLEAQQVGVPVVCSTAGSLPEVAGEAAIFFNPLSIGEMAKAIVQVAQDAELRDILRQKGFQNVTRFSWEQTAKQTLQIYQNVVNHSI
jgi:glycosyltransferase involved in cell wall biosynthesis